jgi:WD40 repeat protein
MARLHYRVFVSSPSDVRPERLIAERVVQKLARELGHHCDVEAVLWEREPLLAGHHFQDFRNIPPPRTTDICIVVLWSRLGIQLPPDEFIGALTSRAVTGTEWEFEDALASYRARGLPDLLLYHKTAVSTAELSDRAAVEEQLRQGDLVRDFLDRWLKSADGASFTAASHQFAATAEFEERLEEHLRVLLRRRLEKDLGSAAEIGTITWTEPPWRGLAAFEAEQAAVFFGRTRARNEAREKLAEKARTGKAFLLVMGASGSGKSSLVKAGLLPDLMLPGMIGRVALVRDGGFQPADAGGDPVLALAATVLAALPELAELRYTPERLAEQLRRNPEQVGFVVEQGLCQVGQSRLTAVGEARLVLVVDQLEELFTDERITPAERSVFVGVLAALARSGLVWVIATMRSDFFDRLEALPALVALSDGGQYLLVPPTIAELGQIVRGPAQAAGLRFDVDEANGEGLDDIIVKAAATDPGALPLLSFALDQLWQRRDQISGRLTLNAYAELGGFEGALGHRAEEVLQALPRQVQDAFPEMLLALVTVGAGPAPRPTARAVALALFGPGTSAAALVAALLAPEARLLVADGEAAQATIRIAHEALLSAWPRARGEIGRHWEDLQRRARVEAAAALWLAEARSPSRLLPAGLTLSEAEETIARFPQIDAAVRAFTAASATAATGAAKRRVRILTTVATVLLVLTVSAAAGAWFGLTGQRTAQAQAMIAEDARSQADRERQRAVEQADIADRAKKQAELRLAQATLSHRQFLASAVVGEPNPQTAEAVLLAELPGRLDEPDATEVPRQLLWRLPRALSDDRQRIVLNLGKPSWFRSIDAMFSPDGSQIATAGDDVRIWDARTGQLMLVFGNGVGVLTSMSYSPDGARIVTSSLPAAQVWDARTGKQITQLKGHGDYVNSAAFSPDGSRVVTVSKDGTARVWDALSGDQIFVLNGRTGDVRHATFSPDGSRILTSSVNNNASDNTAQVWDVESGAQMSLIHARCVCDSDVAFSPDGSRVVTASLDGLVVWDAATGVQVAAMAGYRGPIGLVVFSPLGTLVAATEGHAVRIWNSRTGAQLAALPHHDDVIDCVFSPNGADVVTTSADKTARIWNVATGTLIATLPSEDLVRKAAFSPDGKRLVTVSDDGTARIWDARGGPEVAVLRESGPEVAALREHRIDYFYYFDPTGTRLLRSSFDGSTLWDAVSGRVIATLPGFAIYGVNGNYISTAAMNDDASAIWNAKSGQLISTLKGAVPHPSGDGSRIATFVKTDKTARVWDARTFEQVAVLRGFSDNMVLSLSFDGAQIATSSWNDSTVFIWDVRTAAQITVLKTGGPVASAAFSPDGKYMSTFSTDWLNGHKLNVWNLQTGARIASVPGIGSSPIPSFSPDGSTFISVAPDGVAGEWNASTGTEVARFGGGSHRIRFADFSPDGSHIVTAGEDNTARVWDARTGADILVLQGHQGKVLSAWYAPDGARILTGSEDGTARVWDARSGSQLAMYGQPGVGVGRPPFPFSKDGSRAVIVGEDGIPHVWTAATGAEVAMLAVPGSVERDPAPVPKQAAMLGESTVASFSADGSRVVTNPSYGSGPARLWDWRSDRIVLTLQTELGGVTVAKLNPDGSSIVLISFNTPRLWNVRTNALIAELSGHTRQVTAAAFSEDGSRLATASDDHTARLWDSRTGAPIAVLHHDETVTAVAFSPDGSRVATASRDHTARLWDASTGAELALLKHEDDVVDVEFSPDGTRVVTAGTAAGQRVWDARSGMQIMEGLVNQAPFQQASAAKFSPDGTRILITYNSSKIAGLWDAATGTRIAQLMQDDTVETARFSPDGASIVTASDDKTARIWDASTGAQIGDLIGHEGPVTEANFSSDNAFILTASRDGTARVWANPGFVSQPVLDFARAISTYTLKPTDRTRYGILDPPVEAAPVGLLHCDALAGDAEDPHHIGSGVPFEQIDAARAIGACRADLKAHPGEPRLEYQLARALIRAEPPQLKEAKQIIDGAAAAGYVAAIAIVAIAEMQTDPSHAMSLLQRAEAGGAFTAATDLGDLYWSGATGIAQDRKAAIAAWMRAARAGDPNADANLASLYLQGIEIPVDLSEAFFFHALAERLFQRTGAAMAARSEAYRRAALAYLLPPSEVSRLIQSVARWEPGKDLPQ